ncbi:unnamed protein product, partial [Rotaria magnacalcarata]
MITFIELQSRRIGEKGVEYLADALINNDRITSVNLNRNEINDQGLKYLVNVLKNDE